MIWLIGNKGMLGTEVERLLKKNQLDYIASDREVDITNLEQIYTFTDDKPLAWIVNCAAYTAVDKAEDEPELAFRINADGPLNIAKIARDKGARLIHLSTDYVFGGLQDCALTETDSPNPICVYSASKYQGEVNVTRTLKSHFIIRSAWLYGQNGPNFVYTMLRQFREKDEVRVVDDQWGSPTYAPDLAELLVHIIASDSHAYGVYHFTNDGRINWHQFASAIYELAKKEGLIEREVQVLPISTCQYPTKARRPAYAYLSKEKICRTFDITLKPWQQSLSRFMGSCNLAL